MTIHADLMVNKVELQGLLHGDCRILDIEDETGWRSRPLADCIVVDAAIVRDGDQFIPLYFVARFPVGWRSYTSGVRLMAVTGWKQEGDHLHLLTSTNPRLRLDNITGLLLYHDGVVPDGYDDDINNVKKFAAAERKMPDGTEYRNMLIAEFVANVPKIVDGMGE